jgi:nicotinate-nucleotide adenylyltransferase
MKKTGLFPGSFNPIHHGHLIIACYLVEFGYVDEVWFVVSPQNPFKQAAELASEAHRIKMVECAIAGDDRFRTSDVEFNLPKPSYTIHTIDTLKRQYPEREFVLIMGADNLAGLPQWKDYERLITECEILVYERPGAPQPEQFFPASVEMVEAPVLEISATLVRSMLQQGKSVRYLVPGAVREYLRDHKLYQ